MNANVHIMNTNILHVISSQPNLFFVCQATPLAATEQFAAPLHHPSIIYCYTVFPFESLLISVNRIYLEIKDRHVQNISLQKCTESTCI